MFQIHLYLSSVNNAWSVSDLGFSNNFTFFQNVAEILKEKTYKFNMRHVMQNRWEKIAVATLSICRYKHEKKV